MRKSLNNDNDTYYNLNQLWANDTTLTSSAVDGILKEENEKLKGVENVIITPHVGSRTYQSVVRQGTMAVENLIEMANN